LKVKMLHVNADNSLSLQKHAKRSEFFFMPNGEVQVNLPGVWHVLNAPPNTDVNVLEVQLGESEEEDIEKVPETAEDFEVEKQKRIQLNQF